MGDITSNLIAWWKFTDGSGSSAIDSSGNNYTGTLQNSPTWVTGNIWPYAINFNGTNQYMTLPGNIPLSSDSGAITLSCWFKTTSDGCLFGDANSNAPSAPGSFDPLIYIESTGIIHAGGWIGSVPNLVSSSAYNDGIWHQVVFTYDGSSELKLYVDGSLVDSLSSTMLGVSGTNYWQIGAGYTNGSWPNANGSWWYFNGDIDDARIYSRALSSADITTLYAYGTSTNYTDYPSVLSLTSILLSPIVEISKNVSISSLSLTSSLLSPMVTVGPVVSTFPFSLSVSLIPSNLLITSTIFLNHFSLTATLQVPRIIYPGANSLSYASKIISYNPLIIISNTSPVRVAIVDTSSPDSPIYTTYSFSGADYALDTQIDLLGNISIACSSGNILQFNIATPTSYTVINTGAFGNLTSLALLETSDGATSDVYAGSDYILGEVVDMFEGNITLVSTNIAFSSYVAQTFSTKVNTINGLEVNTDIRWSAEVDTIVGCDIRFIDESFEDLSTTPISRDDFVVYIGGIEVPDVKLDSIEITHTADEKSQAEFILARQHDNVNYTMNGVYIPVLGNPSVQITIAGHPEFGYDTPATVWDVDCKSENEQVRIVAYSELPKTDVRSNVTLSIPGINEKLHVYHALIDNPTIDNPSINPGDPNPPFYLGIQIDPGYQRTQNILKFQGFSAINQDEEQKINYVFGSGDSGISDINGNNIYFKPYQNWTYFWFGHATNFITGATWTGLLNNGASYLGTSPSSLTSSTWDVDFIDWWYQREMPDTVIRLGTGTLYESDLMGIPGFSFPHYTDAVYSSFTGTDVWTEKQQLIIRSQAGNPEVGQLIIQNGNVINTQTGEALTFGDYTIIPSISTALLDAMDAKLGVFFGSSPYKKVSCKSGIFTPVGKWVDQTDGLYIHTDEGYNYTNYVNQIGRLEYEKIQNINGSVLPKTKVDIQLFLDGYYFFGIELLMRVNIDNTIQPNIYNGQNGFPVSIKSIHISSKDMKVTLDNSNAWSRLELLEIDSERPDPNLSLTPETMKFYSPKFDPNSLNVTS